MFHNILILKIKNYVKLINIFIITILTEKSISNIKVHQENFLK